MKPELLPHRITFALAAAYNLAFGLWAGLFPLAYFDLFELEPPRYPSIWACLGMVIGLYGIAYAYVARHPDRGDLIAAIGLAGKILGPAGWLLAVARGEFPARTFPLILANDLLWWFPFLFYLTRQHAWRRSIVAWTSVAVHLFACFGLLAVRGGTEAIESFAERQRWVSQHFALWVFAWVMWVLASTSLLALFVVWSGRLLELGATRFVVAAGCVVCAIGLGFDLAGETINIAWLTRPALTAVAFERGARLYTMCGAAVANGLYCVAGLGLSWISWRLGFLRGAIGLLGFAMWFVGLGLTAAALTDHRTGMVAGGAGVMSLFLVWAGWLGMRLAPARAGWDAVAARPTPILTVAAPEQVLP